MKHPAIVYDAGAAFFFSVETIGLVGYDALMSIQIDFQQLQSNLPHFLKRVEAGDTLVVCEDDKPIAEIRPIKKRRPVGLGEGKITIAPNCFDPLPEEILDAFEGKVG